MADSTYNPQSSDSLNKVTSALGRSNLLRFPSDLSGAASGMGAPEDGGSAPVLSLSSESGTADTYSGEFIERMIRTVEKVVPAYSRQELRREHADLNDAFNLCHFELLKCGPSETREALALYNISGYLLRRIGEVREVLKGICPYCEWTPCRFGCSEVPDYGSYLANREGSA